MSLLTVIVTILSFNQAHADIGDQLFKLLAEDATADQRFGSDFAMDGSIAILGAPFDMVNGIHSGSAYLFNTVTGQQLFKLIPDDGAAEDRFGGQVGISGSNAVIGSIFDDENGNNSGSAYLFNSTTGLQIAKLQANDVEVKGLGRNTAARLVAIASYRIPPHGP